MGKKKILFHSNCSRILTGFGKNARNVLSYLYKTGKYEIVEAANGVKEDSGLLELFPWECVGTFPAGPEMEEEVAVNNELKAKAGYGLLTIDSIIEKVRPDIFIGVEDIWAFNGFWDKRWWDKVNCMLWVTIDSSPVLQQAIDAAGRTPNFFCWSGFAQKEMLERGVNNVKALHGPIDGSNFFRLEDSKKASLRKRNGIKKEDFIVGFVFRNQLRKSVPNLLDGFLIFKKENPKLSPKLLMHTNWQEGWDIPRLIKEKGVENSDILTTYYCKKCLNYEVKPFASDRKITGEKKECRFCGGKKTQNTIKVEAGPSEGQLNEIYNLMDVYCHPFTSGGQELPIQEAKLCELITLVTDYSCGQDCSSEDSGGMPLSWHEYREPGTQFIKASTDPESIAAKLKRVSKMGAEKRRSLEKLSRKFVLENYSIEKTCEELMKAFDECPEVEWDYDVKALRPNTDHKPRPDLSDSDFVKDVYENMLKVSIKEGSDVFDYLLKKLRAGVSREKITKALRDNALSEQEASDKKEYNMANFVDKDDEGRRLALVLPKSIGDIYISTSILKSLKETYPEYNIYYITNPQYFCILDGNPYVHKTIPYNNQCDDVLYLEGYGGVEGRKDSKGFFEIAILLHAGNQRFLNYTRNGKDKISLELCI
jgi:glycosyltransferase involved in cell wall biosynthesis